MTEAHHNSDIPNITPIAGEGRYIEPVAPLAPIARAYLFELGDKPSDPHQVLSFIDRRLEAFQSPTVTTPQNTALQHADIIVTEAIEPPTPRPLLALPRNRVSQVLDEQVLPVHINPSPDRVVRENQATESKEMVNKAFLYPALLDVAQAIYLRGQLHNLGRPQEARDVTAVLEAYGRVISKMPKEHGLLKEAARQYSLRRRAR
jgi:hypothetical protein